jgi:hypothetical protein
MLLNEEGYLIIDAVYGKETGIKAIYRLFFPAASLLILAPPILIHSSTMACSWNCVVFPVSVS